MSTHVAQQQAFDAPPTGVRAKLIQKMRRAVVSGYGLAALAVLIAGMTAGIVVCRTSRTDAVDPDVAFADGLEALERNDPEGVERAISALAGVTQYDSHVRYLRARCLFEFREYDAVLAHLRPTRAAGALRGRILLLVAQSFYHQGQLIEAERLFRGLTIEQPDEVEAHRWLVPIYREMGALDLALQELRHVARLEPDDYRTFRLMAVIHKEDRLEYAEAIDCYRKALDRRPSPDDRRQIALEFGEALLFLRDYSTTLDVLQQAQPTAQVWAMRAECHWNLGQRDSAHDALQQAFSLNPRDRTALLLHARICMTDDDPGAAIDALQQALALDRNDWESLYQLGLACQQAGDTERAETVMAQMGQARELRSQLNELVRKARTRPGDVGIRREIVVLCNELGQTEMARFWERAAELSQLAATPSQEFMPETAPYIDLRLLPNATLPDHADF